VLPQALPAHAAAAGQQRAIALLKDTFDRLGDRLAERLMRQQRWRAVCALMGALSRHLTGVLADDAGFWVPSGGGGRAGGFSRGWVVGGPLWGGGFLAGMSLDNRFEAHRDPPAAQRET